MEGATPSAPLPSSTTTAPSQPCETHSSDVISAQINSTKANESASALATESTTEVASTSSSSNSAQSSVQSSTKPSQSEAAVRAGKSKQSLLDFEKLQPGQVVWLCKSDEASEEQLKASALDCDAMDHPAIVLYVQGSGERKVTICHMTTLYRFWRGDLELENDSGQGVRHSESQRSRHHEPHRAPLKFKDNRKMRYLSHVGTWRMYTVHFDMLRALRDKPLVLDWFSLLRLKQRLSTTYEAFTKAPSPFDNVLATDRRERIRFKCRLCPGRIVWYGERKAIPKITEYWHKQQRGYFLVHRSRIDRECCNDLVIAYPIFELGTRSRDQLNNMTEHNAKNLLCLDFDDNAYPPTKPLRLANGQCLGGSGRKLCVNLSYRTALHLKSISAVDDDGDFGRYHLDQESLKILAEAEGPLYHPEGLTTAAQKAEHGQRYRSTVDWPGKPSIAECYDDPALDNLKVDKVATNKTSIERSASDKPNGTNLAEEKPLAEKNSAHDKSAANQPTPAAVQDLAQALAARI